MKQIYNVLNGNIDVPDAGAGKAAQIDTKVFTNPHRWGYYSSGGRIPHWHKYEPDFLYEEMYQAITELDSFWLDVDLFNKGLGWTCSNVNMELIIHEDEIESKN